jgi:NADH:ubiquinone oxidoreductase subunit 6 (subunit J)/NADH:ubiquinone oxidoreductase subunit 3 (subunit A)
MELFVSMINLKLFLSILAIIAGLFVITTKNAIISVFNLIVLYILVAFYLIYIGITYLGISYIVVYVGAIAILFLFVIMMIDIEVVEKRNNNYLFLLFLLLCGFLFTLKNILLNIGVIKIRSIVYKEKDNFEVNKFKLWRNNESEELFDLYKNFLIDKNEDNISNNIYNIIGKFELDNINLFDVYINKSIVNFDIFNNNLFNYNYLTIMPDWNSSVNRITQVSAIGDILYTVYHSYIYILSIILLLGMIGAIILTIDIFQKIKVVNIEKTKKIKNNIIFTLKLVNFVYVINISIIKKLYNKISNILNMNKFLNNVKKKGTIVPFFSDVSNIESIQPEGIMGNLTYFTIISIILGLLLLLINSYLSLNIKYLEKGGGFECGFTSFVQTRERFNVIFYRVSLLFLIFDLEIILIYPYPVLYQKNQNISKNNVLIFLYILIIGFIYELKEGALNIVKKAHNNRKDN